MIIAFPVYLPRCNYISIRPSIHTRGNYVSVIDEIMILFFLFMYDVCFGSIARHPKY